MNRKRANKFKTINFAKTCEIKVTVIPIDVLEKYAIENFNQIIVRNMRGVIFNNSNKNVPKSIIINYIRHNLTNYDELLRTINSLNVPVYFVNENIVPVLRHRVDHEIRQAYGFSTGKES